MENKANRLLDTTEGYKIIIDWFNKRKITPFSFQEETWQHIINNQSGLVNAPTGCGKTFSVFIGAIIEFINCYPDNYLSKKNNGLQLLWITPLRALAKDIQRAMEEVINSIGLQWKVGSRNGDTSVSERQKQKRQMPEILIITPESAHLLLAQKGYAKIFSGLKTIAVDEWHELIGTKRGVQVELAISRIIACSENDINIWGISATIGNIDEAMEVLMASLALNQKTTKGKLVKADIHKQIDIESIFPDEIEKYPWSGHLGLKLVRKIIDIINNNSTTLIFINTRGMSERWYQTILDECPELAGAIALHHGSIDMEMREWVEDALHNGVLKAVVCTSSLDLGVDFRPVETVVQVGSPKGVARFLQRAGRSGHQPGEISKIYFLPTHSLELVEAAALKSAKEIDFIESRDPMILCFDVLIQYLCTLAISDGFDPVQILPELRSTYCYAFLSEEEFREILFFITSGGTALQQYDEYKKVEVINNLYRITSRKIAMRHRMHIGTIVSDPMLKVKFQSGGYIGMIEEYFVAKLQPRDAFTLSGRNLEFIMIKDMTVIVKKSTSKKSIVPSWNGGRLPLSSNLGLMLRKKFHEAFNMINENIQADDIEITTLYPLFELQKKLSHIPKENELLIEHIETRDGFHVFIYPFEGRLVHEALAALLSYRISRITPITFSFAMNDYGFELLSDQPIPIDDSNAEELFSSENLLTDIQKSVNAAEMTKRKFRDIAVIGGLIFQGYPGEYKKARHLQSSASLLYQVFSEYDNNNLLLRQAFKEVMEQQMEEVRLRDTLSRIQQSKIIISFPEKLTPFCFPLKVDSLRENFSSEKLEDRVRRMQEQLSK